MTDPLLGQQRGISSAMIRLGYIDSSSAGAPVLSLDGNVQGARWAQNYVPTVGDAVAVAVLRDENGQSSNVVLYKVGASPYAPTSLPDEALVTAVPASSPTITVQADGTSYTVKLAMALPAVGDRVLLEHRTQASYAVAKIQPTPAPPAPPPTVVDPPPAPPPGGPTSGTAHFSAIDSATARAGSGWNTPSGQTVTQGSYAGVAYAGSWFYGTGPGSLAGRGIAGARVYLPARRRMGSWNIDTIIRLWAHTSATRPGSDVNRTVGPFDIGVPAGWGGGWINIPVTFAAAVVAGGGLGIAGGAYAGLDGRDANPQSGTIAIDWTL